MSLPGYYYQELSARSFVLLGANYTLPLDTKKHWNLNFFGTTAGVDYLSGLEQPGHWNNGVGAGLLYESPSLKIMLGYAYGVDAIRSHGRGANSVGVLMQLDLEHARRVMLNPKSPSRWRGLREILGVFHD